MDDSGILDDVELQFFDLHSNVTSDNVFSKQLILKQIILILLQVFWVMPSTLDRLVDSRLVSSFFDYFTINVNNLHWMEICT